MANPRFTLQTIEGDERLALADRGSGELTPPTGWLDPVVSSGAIHPERQTSAL